MALRTPGGITLEARVAESPTSQGGVVICHPHPLYGGDMENPVVVRAAEVCAALGLTALRFNFRGVGGSTGTHGGGVAERVDVEAAIDHLRGALADDVGVAVVGALVAAHVRRRPIAGLCLIAPPRGSGAPLPPALGAFGAVSWPVPGRVLPPAGKLFPMGALRRSLPSGGRAFFLASPRGGGGRLGRAISSPDALSESPARARRPWDLGGPSGPPCHRNRGSSLGVAVPAEKMMRMPSSMPTPV